MTGVLDIDHAVARPCLTCPAGPRWQHTIHHIHTARDGPNDIIGFANTHQVTRLVLGQETGGVIQNAKHRFLSFTNGQTTHGIPVEPDIDQGLGAFLSQLRRYAALHDAKQGMAGTVSKGIARTLCPPHRQAHGLCNALFIRRKSGAFIETHHDVRA